MQPMTHVPQGKLMYRGMLVVVGYNIEMAIGQHVVIQGKWGKHQKYGEQLQVRNKAELPTKTSDQSWGIRYAFYSTAFICI